MAEFGITGYVGPQRLGDGVGGQTFRQGNEAQIIAGILGGQYAEHTLRGKLFRAVTPAAGVDHGASLGATAAFALYNPANSKVNLFVTRTRVGYISGTLGAGVLAYAFINNVNGAAPTSGTQLTAQPGYIGGASGWGQAYSGSTISATPTIYDLLGSVAPILATSVVAPWFIDDRQDEGICVPPGQLLAVEGICGAAGSTPKIVIAMTWLERDL